MSVFAFGAPGIQELIVIFMILLIWVATIWGIVHCVRNKRLSDTNRVIGIVVIAVLGPLGILIYLFLPREKSPPSNPGPDANS